MKLIALFCTTGFLLHGTVNAQVGTFFGLKTGYSIANFDSEEFWPADPRKGFHIGGYMVSGQGGIAALSAEVTLNNRGGRSIDNGLVQIGLDQMPLEDVSITTIDVPLMVRINLFPGSYFATGFYGGLVLGKKVSGAGVTEDEAERVKSGFKTGDLGFCAALGYVHPSGIGVDLRGSVSLIDIYDNVLPEYDATYYTAPEDTRTINTLEQFSLVYFFNYEAD